MIEHLKAGYGELTPTRKGERNGHYYRRTLVTPAGKIERLEVPRDREGEFVTEVFERALQETHRQRRGGDLGDVPLGDLHAQGCRHNGLLEPGEDRQGRGELHQREALEDEQRAWRERPLDEAYPYLYLDTPRT